MSLLQLLPSIKIESLAGFSPASEIHMVSRVNRKINHPWLHNGSELIFFDCATNKTLLFYNVKEMKRCKLFCLKL